jgi:hypothetical protein
MLVLVPPSLLSSFAGAAGAGVAINNGGDGGRCGSRYTSYVVFVIIISKRIMMKNISGA